MTFEEALHLVVITKQFKDQLVTKVLEDKTIFDADTDLIKILVQLAGTKALVQMRLANGSLCLCDSLANLAPIGRRHSANLPQ